MTQVQCPNCGGFKVERERLVDPETGKEASTSGCGSWIAGTVATLIFYLFVGLILPSTFRSTQYNDTNAVVRFYVVMAIASGLGIVIVSRKERKRQAALARANKIFDYRCTICGYRWRWTLGDDLPEVTVRPDLIEQGSEKFKAGYCKVCGQPVPENVRNCYYCGTARW